MKTQHMSCMLGISALIALADYILWWQSIYDYYLIDNRQV